MKNFEIGQTVIMPEPTDGDLWVVGGFSATIKGIYKGDFIVEDQDGDCFAVEPERLVKD